MSAINDALRRASSAAKSGPSASPLPPMPVEPAPEESAPPPPPMSAAPPPIPPAYAPGMAPPPLILRPQQAEKGSKIVWVLVILLVLGLAGAGGFYVWQKQYQSALAKDGSQTESEEEITDNDRLAALFGDEKAAIKMAGPDIRTNSVSANPSPAARTPQPAASPVPMTVTLAQPSPAPAAHTPVRFPPLRLQSIFYRPSSPSVIINGKTLFVTDEINGVTVADIQPASVTLVLSGQTNVLTLR